MDINLQGGFKALPTLPGARSADVAGIKKPAEDLPFPSSGKVESPDSVDLNEAEKKRYEQVVKASQSFFKDVFAVSDSTFTIFKDASGQYITRYTSLRDGRVSYYPEPQLLAKLEALEQAQPVVLEIQA